MRHCTHPRIYVLTLWMFVSLLVSIPAISQDFTIRPLPTQQQLPVATVHCIFEDSKGYMWYGTMGSGSGYGGGVCRDNGYQLDTFLPSRLFHQPASDNITGIVETASGELLVSTAAGLFALSGGDCTLRQVLLGDSLPTAFPPINALHTDPHGNVWVGSGKYICRLSSDMQPVALYPDLCNGMDCSVSSFHTDSQGNLFALQWRGGLLRWDAAADSFEVVDWHYMASPVRMVDDAAADTYWVLTWGGGIVRMQMTGDSVSSLVPQAVTLDGYSRNRGYDLLRDSRHGMLWLSSPDDLYVYRVVGDTLCEVPTTAFLPESRKIVDQLCESRTGDIYVAGFSPHTFIIAPRPQDMVRHEVSPISASTGYPLLPDAVCFDGKRIWLYQGRQGLTLYDIDTGNLSLAPWKTTPIIVKAPHAEGIYTLRDDTVYHVYDKDNTKDDQGREFKNGIQQATSKRIKGPWVEDFVYLDAYAETCTGVEGSSVFPLHDGSGEWVLMYDLYGSGRYEYQTSKDLFHWTETPQSFTKDFFPRHGSVISITEEELQRLQQVWGKVL